MQLKVISPGQVLLNIDFTLYKDAKNSLQIYIIESNETVLKKVSVALINEITKVLLSKQPIL